MQWYVEFSDSVFLYKVYRVYSNNQEFEVVRLNDQLTSYCDETKVIIKLGRALKTGETRIKIYFLRPNEDEVCHRFLTFLMTYFFMDVLDCKHSFTVDGKYEIISAIIGKHRLCCNRDAVIYRAIAKERLIV